MEKRKFLAIPVLELQPLSPVHKPVTTYSGADKSLAFPIFLFAAQPKEFFFDELKKL
jgi:hypothetical protein